MKIYFNRKVIRAPWGGGAHFMSAMVDYLIDQGHEILPSLTADVDLIFMMDPRNEEGGCSIYDIDAFNKVHPHVKILHRVNECDQRKDTKNMDPLLLDAMAIVDNVVFISDWLQSYFVKKGFAGSSSVVYNGCNTEWYHPVENKELSEPIKLVTHHWSDNYMKGFAVYNALDEVLGWEKSFQFTYIGRYNKGYTPKNTTIIPPLYGNDLGDELRKHDIYVTASRFEPCGMHHIEAAACGLPILYHKDGGAIVDMCKKHGIQFENQTDFFVALEKMKNEYAAYRGMINHDFLSIKRCCDQYHQIIKGMFA